MGSMLKKALKDILTKEEIEKVLRGIEAHPRD